MAEVYSLYRKYRPQSFDEVVGQDKVVEVLKNSIKNNKISHAYLFVGSRGIGKTTLARLLAKELGISPKDIHELDAASHSSVEDIREITEAAYSLPFESKQKMYILDEVHMLSKAAFNALLKTLEEPPAHVIFALATTEFEKIPETIVSRCQSFFLQKPSQAMLADYLIQIAKKEGYSLDKGAAKMIAIAGKNSFRDALVSLQKVLSVASSENVGQDDASSVLDVPPFDLVFDMVLAFFDKDLQKILELSQQIDKTNTDFGIVLDMFTDIAQDIYSSAHLQSSTLEEKYSPEKLEKINHYSKKAQSFSKPLLEVFRLYELMRFVPAKRAAFEVGVLSALEQF